MLYFGKFAFNLQKRISHFLEINLQKNVNMRQMDTPDFNIVVNLFNLFLPKHLACIMSDAPKL